MWARARAVVIRAGAPDNDADDIVQEAFARLEAYTRSHELRSEEAFLVTTALNINRDQARKRSRWAMLGKPAGIEELRDAEPDAHDVAYAKEKLRRAKAGLAKLDPVTERCLIAQRIDGLSIAEIAAREGMQPAATQKRIARAVLFLAKWMDGW
jgi:RNA polymerase sigma-70 factor (ECF subfamily)